MALSEVTLSAKLFSTSSYTLVNCLMLVLRSSSGPLDAAETPVTPGPKTPPSTEQRSTTKVEKRMDRTQRGIETSPFQYSGVFRGPVGQRTRRFGQTGVPQRPRPSLASAGTNRPDAGPDR